MPSKKVEVRASTGIVVSACKILMSYFTGFRCSFIKRVVSYPRVSAFSYFGCWNSWWIFHPAHFGSFDLIEYLFVLKKKIFINYPNHDVEVTMI